MRQQVVGFCELYMLVIGVVVGNGWLDLTLNTDSPRTLVSIVHEV